MSLDVRDVLNLPQDGAATSGRPSKKQKTAASAAALAAARPNLKGLAREIQSLGGPNPIAIVPQLLSSFKKKRVISRKPAARWELRPFGNSARDDSSLVLRHWRRRTEASDDDKGPATMGAAAKSDVAADTEGAAAAAPASIEAAMEDSTFAKYNVQVVVPQYNDDQYMANLQNSEWTREETDYLLALVKDYDLRWPLIWDRYDYRTTDAGPDRPDGPDGSDGPDGLEAAAASTALMPTSQTGVSRTMEDLKARYYEIAAKMMAVQKPAQYMTQAEYSLHGMMANFKPQQEKARKAFVRNALTRSREEVREEEALLLEVRRIMARVEQTNEERRELYGRLDFPHADTDISSFKTSAGLHALLQNLMYHNEKSKKRKSLAAGGGEAVGASVGGPNERAAANMGAAEVGGRRDSIAAAGGGHRRESSSAVGGNVDVAGAAAAAAATAAGGAANKKKGGVQAERRKLTAQEQEVYGVTYHDRLGSGPTFRYEKINKLFTHKSGQQQLRITNILNELDMPARLFMPTAAVTAQFEQLVNAVVQLVDLRKVSDKLDGEIKIEEQRKAERDKLRPAADKKEAKAAEVALKTEDDDGKAAATAAATAAADSKETAAEAAAEAAAETGNRLAVPGSRPGSRPGSSHANGPHKRSASVLSAASDKSAKRQKK